MPCFLYYGTHGSESSAREVVVVTLAVRPSAGRRPSMPLLSVGQGDFCQSRLAASSLYISPNPHSLWDTYKWHLLNFRDCFDCFYPLIPLSVSKPDYLSGYPHSADVICTCAMSLLCSNLQCLLKYDPSIEMHFLVLQFNLLRLDSISVRISEHDGMKWLILTAESVTKRERDEALVDAILNRDICTNSATPTGIPGPELIFVNSFGEICSCCS